MTKNKIYCLFFYRNQQLLSRGLCRQGRADNPQLAHSILEVTTGEYTPLEVRLSQVYFYESS